ncbi:MAG: Co2+/Mg2+ efflux protein ApaG [Bdellovibrionales bacterium]|nr:Co2+/Mg2+ efflux protein ApaG [Bdellovibrionales bacterium]
MLKANRISPYREMTDDIVVTVEPSYIEKQSDPSNGIYAFCYSVRLENLGPHSVQLLSRHWIVHSGGEQYTEILGDGVVGEQPVLHAGDMYSYSSWTVISDPIGEMYGSYTFSRKSGELFEVTIPLFDLVCPIAIH